VVHNRGNSNRMCCRISNIHSMDAISPNTITIRRNIMNGPNMSRSDALHFVMNLISHGRHFNPDRDKTVIKKAVDYLTGKAFWQPITETIPQKEE
jgi:hypothetical protein